MSALVTLPAVVDVSTVASVKASFVASLGSDIVVDASAVQRIGGQGVQLLLSLKQACDVCGRAFSIAKPSPAATDAFRLLGADTLLEPAR